MSDKIIAKIKYISDLENDFNIYVREYDIAE